MRGRRSAHRISVEDLRKIPLGSPRCRWEGNEKLFLKKYNVETRIVVRVLTHRSAALLPNTRITFSFQVVGISLEIFKGSALNGVIN